MDDNSKSGLALLAGIALLATAGAFHAILTEWKVWYVAVGLLGLALVAWGAFGLRADLASMLRQRRGEVALSTLGTVGVLLAVAYLSVLFPQRMDMTTGGKFSLSDQTANLLSRLDKPVHITFFHDPMMRETVELYRQMAAQSQGKITLDLFDPMLNPAQARIRGVEFAGTAIIESEGRKLQIQGPTETEIANNILRVTQGVQPRLCFLDGHGEPDPFSLESHDHMEGGAGGHSHGLGSKLVLHERHGMAKARGVLESLNYKVEKVSLVQSKADALGGCALLVVAGPRSPLLAREIDAIRAYLYSGRNALVMLDPFVKTGLEPVLRDYGIVVDDDLVIDDASHFWTDVSAPAVTEYNRHEITTDVPLTFFAGARSLSPTPQRVPGVSVRQLANTSKSSYGVATADSGAFDPTTSIPGPLTLIVVANRRPEFVESTEAVVRRLREAPAEAAAKPAPKPTKEGADIIPSRLVVVGDSDFATNSFFHIMGNGKLFLNMVNYLTIQPKLIGVEPRTFDQPRVNLTNRQMKGTVFLSLILIPALLALVGLVVWWRQR